MLLLISSPLTSLSLSLSLINSSSSLINANSSFSSSSSSYAADAAAAAAAAAAADDADCVVLILLASDIAQTQPTRSLHLRSTSILTELASVAFTKPPDRRLTVFCLPPPLSKPSLLHLPLPPSCLQKPTLRSQLQRTDTSLHCPPFISSNTLPPSSAKPTSLTHSSPLLPSLHHTPKRQANNTLVPAIVPPSSRFLQLHLPHNTYSQDTRTNCHRRLQLPSPMPSTALSDALHPHQHCQSPGLPSPLPLSSSSSPPPPPPPPPSSS
ncbi:hypothetical protein SprV_0200772400 [Sparganum proliferum]